MSLLSDLGGSLVQAVTGQNPADLQAQISVAEQQLSIAVQTIIALELVLVVESFLMVVMLWKSRRE